MKAKFNMLKKEYKEKKVDYDTIYGFFEGWFAYAKHANTYNLRKKISFELESSFTNEISTKEINRMAKRL